MAIVQAGAAIGGTLIKGINALVDAKSFSKGALCYIIQVKNSYMNNNQTSFYWLTHQYIFKMQQAKLLREFAWIECSDAFVVKNLDRSLIL